MVLPLLHAVLMWDLLSEPLSLYGRRLCRTAQIFPPFFWEKSKI
jgi:hypothetical protein